MPVRTVDYDELVLLPHCIEDWVPANHPARYIRDFVDKAPLESLGFDTGYSPDGRARIACDVLLKIWLYCYYCQIRSTRKAEGACRESMGAIWLCGNRAPDHTTLWRFWNEHHDAIGKLFKESVSVALDVGLVAMVFHAIDGTTIRSVSSRRTGLHADQLAKALKKVDERLAEIERDIAQAGDRDEDGRWQLEKSLENAAMRREQIAKSLERLRREKAESLHPYEPDAKVMNNDGIKTWAWNSQASVDEASGIVVAADVTNEAHDAHCLVPMLEQSAQNLAGNKPELTGLDTAYAKSEQEVVRAQEGGFEIVTATRSEERQRFHRSKFAFDRETMQLCCPLGHQLKHTGSSDSRLGEGRVERFRCTDYKTCPHASACVGKSKNGRKVEISPAHEAMQRQRDKVSAPRRSELMKKRLKTVEPFFGQTKGNDGFRRYLFRGRKKVKCQWEMICLTRNLKILEKKVERTVLIDRLKIRQSASSGQV